MLRGAFEEAANLSPAELREAYERQLAETIAAEGLDQAVAASAVDRGKIEGLADGDSPETTLSEAAGILAIDPDRPAADAIAAEARDILLLGMTNAVLDVETLASGLDGALEPKEVQQKIEGRAPITLEEYALLHGYLAGATD